MAQDQKCLLTGKLKQSWMCSRCEHPQTANKISRSVSMHEHRLLLELRLGIRNLIDNQSDTALGNNIRHAITHLDAHYRPSWINAKHWKQVYNRIRAPTNASHDLRSTNLSCNDWILLTFGRCCKSNEQLINDVQEE